MSEQTRMPVKVDLGAKVNIEVKAEIPTASVGRLVDTLTDIIRPFSEGRALKADLMRLHREEVAFEISKRAAERIKLENPNPKPIPLKILLALLEKGSQEEIGDEFMVELWANLLASAASEESIPPRFAGIIGELSGRQARLLDYIAHKSSENITNGSERDVTHEWLEHIFEYEAHIRNLPKYFETSGLYLVRLGAQRKLTDVMQTVFKTKDTIQYRDSATLRLDFAILRSLDLLEFLKLSGTPAARTYASVAAEYYRITPLGRALMDVAIRQPVQNEDDGQCNS